MALAEDKKVEESAEAAEPEETVEEPVAAPEPSDKEEVEGVGEEASEATPESEEAEEEKPSGPPKKTSRGKRLDWYAVYVYSGHERKVKGNVERMIEVNEAAHLFGNIEVPLEDVIVQRAGKNTRTSRPSFPGYVLFQMVGRDRELERHNDRDFIDAMKIVGDTPGVRGFVGGPETFSSSSDPSVSGTASEDSSPTSSTSSSEDSGAATGSSATSSSADSSTFLSSSGIHIVIYQC